MGGCGEAAGRARVGEAGGKEGTGLSARSICILWLQEGTVGLQVNMPYP